MGAEGPGGLEGLAEMDGSIVAVAVAAWTTGAAAVAVIAAEVAATVREGPVRIADGAGCVAVAAAGMRYADRVAEGAVVGEGGKGGNG